MEPTGLQQQRFRHSTGPTRLPPKQMAGNIAGKVPRRSSTTKAAVGGSRRSSSGNTTGGVTLVFNNGTDGGNINVGAGAAAGAAAAAGGNVKKVKRRSISGKSHGSGTLSSGNGGKDDTIGTSNGGERPARLRSKGPSSSSLPAADPPGLNVRKLSSSLGHANNHHGEGEGGGRVVVSNTWKRLRRTVKGATKLRAGTSGGGGSGGGNHSRSSNGYSGNKHGGSPGEEEIRLSCEGSSTFTNEYDDDVNGNLNANATTNVTGNHAGDYNNTNEGDKTNPSDAWKRLRHKAHVVRGFRNNSGMRDGGSGESHGNTKIMKANGDIYAIANVNGNGLGSNQDMMVSNKTKEIHSSRYMAAPSPSHERQQQLRNQRQYQLQPPQQLHPTQLQPSRTTIKSNHPRGVLFKSAAPQRIATSTRRIGPTSSSGRSIGRHSQNARQYMSRGNHPNVHKHGQTHRPHHGSRLRSIDKDEENEVKHIKRKITPIDEDKEGVPEEEDDDDEDDDTSTDSNDIDPTYSSHNGVALDQQRTTSSYTSPVANRHKNHGNARRWDEGTPTDQWGDDQDDQFQQQLQDQWRLLHLIQQQMGVEKSPTRQEGEQDEDRAYQELCEQIKILQELQDHINMQKEKDRMDLKSSVETKYPDEMQDSQDWKDRQHIRQADDGNSKLEENNPPKPPFQKSDNDNLTLSTTSTEPPNSQVADDCIYQVSPEIDDIDESSYPSRSSSPMRSRLSELSHALESDLENSLEVFEDDNDDSTYEKRQRGFASSFPTIPGEGDLDSFLMSDSSGSSDSMSSKSSQPAATVASLSTRSTSVQTCKLSPRTLCPRSKSNSTNNHNQGKLPNEELMKVILDIQTVCNAAKAAVDSDPDTNSRSSDDSSQSSSSASTSVSASSDSSPITDHGLEVETVISDITNFTQMQPFQPGSCEASDLPIPSHIDNYGPSKAKIGAVEFEEMKELERQLRNPVIVPHKTSVYSDSDIESYTDRVVKSMRPNPPLHPGKRAENSPKVSKPKRRKAKKVEKRPKWKSEDNEQDVESYTDRVVTSELKSKAPKAVARSKPADEAPKESAHPTMHIGATFTKGASVYSVESYTDRVVTSMRAPQAKNAAASSKLPVQDRTNHVKETVSSTHPRILRDVESFADRIVVDPRMPPPFTMNTEDTPQQSTRSENMDKSAALRRRQATECARAPTLASEETFTSRDASTMSLSKTNDQAKDETKFSPEENNLVDHSEAAGVIKRSSHVSNDEEAIRSKESNSTPEAWQTKATFFEATDEVGDGNEEASKSSTIETLDPSGKLQPKKESFHVSATDEESNSGSRSIQTDPTGALGYRNSFIYKVPKTDKINGLNRSFPQSCILKTPRSDSRDDLKVKNGDVSPKGKSTVNDNAIRSTKDCDYACKKHIVGTHRNPSLLQTTVAQNGSDQDTIQHSVEQMMDQGRRLKHKNECENTSYIHKLISTGPPPLGHHGRNDSTRRFTMSESSGASMQSSTDNLDKTIYEPRQVDDTKFLELCNQWKMAHTALQYALGDENYSKHQLPNTNGSPHPAEELHHPIDVSCNFGHHSVSDDKHEADENANHVNVDIDQENEQDAVYIYVKDDVSTTSSKVDGYAGTVISDITSFTQPFFSNSYNGYRIPGLGHFNLSNQVPPKSHIIPTPGNPYAGSEDSYPAVANYTQSVDHSANTQQLRFSNPTTSKYTVGEGEIQCESEIAKIARTILNGKIDNKPHSYNFERSTPQKSQSIGIPGGVNSASNNPENLNSSLNMSEGQLSSISQLLNDIADLSCSNAKISRIQSSLEDARSSDNINKRFQVHNSHNGTANSSGSTRFGDSSLTSHDPGDCGNGSDGVGISCKSSQQRRTGKTEARCEDLSKESIHATSKVHDDEVTETVDSPPESQISDLATKARDLVVSPDKCGVDYVDRVGEADAVRSSTDLDDINHSHHSGSGNEVDHFDEGSHTNDVESKENILSEKLVSQTVPLQLKDTGACMVLTGSPGDSKKTPWPHSEISLPPEEHIRLDEKRTQEFDEAKVDDDGDNAFNMDTTCVPTSDESERSNYSMSSGKKESGWARVRQRVTYMDILNRMQAKKNSGRSCNSPVHSIAEEGRHDQVENVLNEDDEYEENQMQQYSLFSSGRAVETSYDNNGEILGTDDGNPHEEYQAHSVDDYGYVDGNSTKPLQHFQSTNHKNEANSYLGAYLERQHMYGPIYDRDDVSFATLQTMKQLYTQSVGNQESIAKSRPEHLPNRALYSEKDLAKDIITTNPTSNKQRNSSGSPGPKLSKSSQFSKFSNSSKSSKLAASSKQSASKILCKIPSDSCEHEPETKPATNALPKRSSESSSRMTKSDNNNSFLRQIQHLQREVVDEEVLIASANKITTEKNRDLSSYANGLLDDDIEIKWDELKDPFQNDYELDHFEDEFSAANSFSGSTNSHNSVDSHGTDTSAHKKITSGWAKVREKVTYLDILNKMKVQGDGCTSPVHSVVGSESHRNSSFSDDGSVCNNVDDATSTGSPDSVLSWNQFEADNMQEKNIGEENYSQDDLSTNSDSCWHQEEFKSKLNSSETPCEKVESIGSDNYPKRSSNSFQVNIPLQDSTRESSGSLSGDNLVTSKPNRSRRSSYAPDNTSFFSIEMDENSDIVESAQTSHGDPSKASSNFNVDELALFLRRHCALEKKISSEKCEESNDGKSNCTPASAESTISGSTKGHRGPPTRSPSPDGSRASMASFSRKCSTFGNTYATMSRQIDYLLREEEESGFTAA